MACESCKNKNQNLDIDMEKKIEEISDIMSKRVVIISIVMVVLSIYGLCSLFFDIISLFK